MAQKKVLISIDEALNKRWGECARRLDFTKSGMIEEYLSHMIPILEQESPDKMLLKAMKKVTDGFSVEKHKDGSLFDER